MNGKRFNTLVLTAAIVLVGGIVTIWALPDIFWGHESRHPVQVYYADHISPAHQAAIDQFNRQHSGRIEVVPVNLPFDKFNTNERKELLARSLRSKSEKLDVFAVDLIWVPRFAKWCEPLDAYFVPEERQKLLSYALESCVYDSAMVAAPLYIDIGLMYYRRDIIRRLPDAEAVERRLQESISWKEMERLRARLGYNTKPYYLFQGKEYEGLVCNFFELAQSHDLSFVMSRPLNLRTAAAEQALGMLAGLVTSRMSPLAVVDFNENLSYAYMLDHDAVFVRGWPNFIENFFEFYPDKHKLRQLGRAPLPHVEGHRSTSVFGGWDLMVSKASTRKAEAVEFVKFMQSEATQRLMFERGGYIPILKSAYKDSAWLEAHRELTFYHRLLQRGFHRPALVEYTKMSDIISHYVHRAIKGELPVGEALRRADAMIRSNAVLIK